MWDAHQKARFNMEGHVRTNPYALVAELLEYDIESRLITEIQKAKNAATILVHYLTNPVFCDTIGLQNSHHLIIAVPQDEFNRGETRFLLDASKNDPDVNFRSSEEARKTYAEKLRYDDDAPTTRGLSDAIQQWHSWANYISYREEAHSRKFTHRRFP